MTLKEAIEIIEELGIDCRGYPTLKKAVDAVLEYTKAQLSQEVTTKDATTDLQPTCNDAISRQAAKLKVARVVWEDGDTCYDFSDKCVDCLDDVPSVTQELLYRGAISLDKQEILQAGYEGREYDFYIGGRLFSIRQKAQ